jgi:hypothetical protein
MDKAEYQRLVAEMVKFLRQSGFGPNEHTKRLGAFPARDFIDPRAFVDKESRRTAHRTLGRLEQSGVTLRDPYCVAVAIAGHIVGSKGTPPLSLLEYIAAGPPARTRGRKRIGNYERNIGLEFAINHACIWGDLKPTRNPHTKKDVREPCGCSIVAEALRQIGGVRLSEKSLARIYSEV